MIEMERPTFLKSVLEAWQINLDERGPLSLVPYWIVACGAAGWWLTWSLTPDFWGDERAEIAVATMAGLLALNGLILALSWSAFSKIYEIIGAGDFCAFLRRNKLLSQYLVFVGYVHISQILAVASTSFAMFSLLLPLQLWAVKLSVAGAVATTIYALKQGVAASTVMHDLVWQKSTFDHERPAQPPMQAVRAGNG